MMDDRTARLKRSQSCHKGQHGADDKTEHGEDLKFCITVNQTSATRDTGYHKSVKSNFTAIVFILVLQLFGL